jgi:hypothetical protein
VSVYMNMVSAHDQKDAGLAAVSHGSSGFGPAWQ